MTIAAFAGRFDWLTLFAPAVVAASSDGTIAIDTRPYEGTAKFRIAAAAAGTGVTRNARLQHSDTQGGTYTDVPGGAFPVSAANTAQDAELQLDVNALRPWVRVAFTVAGGTAAGAVYVGFGAQRKY